MAKPKLRFPEFTDEWEEKQLKDFMVFKNGLNADKDKFGSGIKFISVMDILNNPFITYDIIRGKVDVDEKTLDNYSVTYGDVLFQRSSETREDAGKSNVYLDKKNTATFGGFVIRGKKIGDYSPEFMNSLLKSPKVRKEITSKAQGAQHINVGQETLENVSIVLPTVKEQEKIANFLSSVDDIIEEQKEKITVLEEQKRGIMQKLFNREVRFKADDGSEYPEWEEKKLLNIGVIITGTTPSTKNEEYYSDKYLWVTPADIEGKEISNTQKKLSEDGLKKGRIIPADSVLVTCIASIGKNTILRELGSCNQQINAITPNKEYNVDFVYYLICFNENMLHANAGHGGMEILNKDQFSKLSMHFPCLEEQQKIADCLSAYDEAIQIKKDKLEVWKKIKKGLLQQMFV